VAGLQQLDDGMAAHKPGCARNQDFHGERYFAR
jgi:hypothetical protein